MRFMRCEALSQNDPFPRQRGLALPVNAHQADLKQGRLEYFHNSHAGGRNSLALHRKRRIP